MNKKILAGIFTLFFCAIVFATISNIEVFENNIVKNEKGTAADFIQGSNPNYAALRSNFKLYEGWNLVPVGSSPRTPCLRNEADFDTTMIKYRFYYFPDTGYIGGRISPHNNDLKDASIQEQFQNKILSLNENELLSMAIGAYWIYSDGRCEFESMIKTYRDIENEKENLDKIQLTKGWNIIHAHYLFMGPTFGEILTNCEVLKANTWEPWSQKWKLTGTESASAERIYTLLNSEINESNVNMPLVIKVAETCNLSGESQTDPPELPL